MLRFELLTFDADAAMDARFSRSTDIFFFFAAAAFSRRFASSPDAAAAADAADDTPHAADYFLSR